MPYYARRMDIKKLCVFLHKFMNEFKMSTIQGQERKRKFNLMSC